MLKRFIIIGVTITLLWSIPVVFAHKATGIYIPIGRSPGLSGKYTTVGKIGEMRRGVRGHTMKITDSSGRKYTLQMTKSTAIWLDRSKLKLVNQKGAHSDCQRGRLCEVKYINNDMNRRVVEWIKLEITKR